MGSQLSQLLRDAIDEVTADSERPEEAEDDVIGTMAFGSGVTEDTIREILNGDIECPPPSRTGPLAEELPISESDVEDALADDGCEQFQNSYERGMPSYQRLADTYES